MFLNGVVEEKVYVERSLGSETHDRETHVCKLKKALYSLKHEPRTWYDGIDSFLYSLVFTKSKVDSKIYYKVEEGNPMILLLYVDDLFVTGEDELIADMKRKLAAKFKMKDLGMYDALIFRHGGVAESRWNLPGTGEVCSRDTEEVRDDGLQGHGHTYGIESKAIE